MMRAGERRESGLSRGCRVEVLLAAFAIVGAVRVLDVESDVAVRGARLLGRLNLKGSADDLDLASSADGDAELFRSDLVPDGAVGALLGGLYPGFCPAEAQDIFKHPDRYHAQR